MGKGFFRKVRKKIVDIGDPDRDQRIEAFAKQVEALISQQRERFDLGETLVRLGARKVEKQLVVESAYRRFLRRAWKDGVISDGERNGLTMVASKLDMHVTRQRELEFEAASDVFERKLAEVFEDGRVESHEMRGLEQVSRELSECAKGLLQGAYRTQCESFLKNVFARLSGDPGRLQARWHVIRESAEMLGIRKSELAGILKHQVHEFVEHVLADAQMDQRLDDCEERQLDWILAELPVTQEYREYITSVMNHLRTREGIARGELPVIENPGVELEAGELCHFIGTVVLDQVRQLKSGPRTDRYRGNLVVTDNRLIFESPEKTFMVSHKRIVRVTDIRGGLEIRASSRASGHYYFVKKSLGPLIVRVALARANQQIVSDGTDGVTRHISRAVRQRVWQRHGGRCAECGSDQYLEFDHIIPHAKGGSNSDQNVQLLCRGCNLKKSDAI